MASTTQGAILTDKHRRRQVRASIAAESEIRRAWRLLDLDDIDAGRLAWQHRMVNIVARHHQVSQAQALAYVSQYRIAELGIASGPLVAPRLGLAQATRILDAAGPQGLKHRIGQGTAARTAYMEQRGVIIAETRRLIMAGGRGVVRESAARDTRAVGWRRVSDGDPCTFCAMLVSRGPAYTSEARALSRGNDDPYHRKCGCSVEILYGPWDPTELEQRWVDAYYDAATEANSAGEQRTASTVLHRMRDNGTFRDSPLRRAVAP